MMLQADAKEKAEKSEIKYIIFPDKIFLYFVNIRELYMFKPFIYFVTFSAVTI